MSDRAPRPHGRRPGRHRRTPQTWLLRPTRRPGCRRLLAALGFGGGAALVAFGIVLVVLPGVV